MKKLIAQLETKIDSGHSEWQHLKSMISAAEQVIEAAANHDNKSPELKKALCNYAEAR